MKSIFHFSIFMVSFLLLSQIAGAQATRADHTTADLTLIPDGALSLSANLRVMLRRASVGGNISGGLDALQSANAKYNRSHWIFYDRGNPGWQAKIADFVSFTIANESTYDVFSMKFCFIDPDADFNCYRDSLLWLENHYLNKIIVWWTIPIETSGNTNRQLFNDSVRAYAMAHGKILFDMADIESHNAAGEKLVDGSGRELQQGDWSSDGGHLNTAGSLRVASAWWWLMARVAGWNGTTEVEKQGEAPHVFIVSQNYPNPFNPSTIISYSLPAASYISLKIYDILGREIITLVNEVKTAGAHSVQWDGKNSQGIKVGSGVYFYQLRTESGFIKTQKMIMLN
jgi:Flagellar hook capping protein